MQVMPRCATEAELKRWLEWLTPERLDRWNGLRVRAMLEPITQRDGALILANVDEPCRSLIRGRIE